MIFADITPSAEDMERFVKVAATYGEDVIDAMLWAYGVGCIRGSAQGSARDVDQGFDDHGVSGYEL